MTEDRWQMTEVRGQRTDDRRQMTEDRGQMAEISDAVGLKKLMNIEFTGGGL
jgi:hypothetical protein